MLTYDLITYKILEEELHRQAAHYRLVKSLKKNNPLLSRLYSTIGNALIVLGQALVNRTQVAH